MLHNKKIYTVHIFQIFFNVISFLLKILKSSMEYGEWWGGAAAPSIDQLPLVVHERFARA